MANITINNLNSAGSDLFTDYESYLKDLSETELNLQGGLYSGTWEVITVLTRTSGYYL